MGSYKLDNGDGHQDFSDLEHRLVIAREPVFGSWRVCVARGSTQFGKFVSLGFVHVDDDNNNGRVSMILARRYVLSGQDWRVARMNLDKDKGYVTKAGLSTGLTQICDGFEQSFREDGGGEQEIGKWLEANLPLQAPPRDKTDKRSRAKEGESEEGRKKQKADPEVSGL
jgi:hypothetical protein